MKSLEFLMADGRLVHAYCLQKVASTDRPRTNLHNTSVHHTH